MWVCLKIPQKPSVFIIVCPIFSSLGGPSDGYTLPAWKSLEVTGSPAASQPWGCGVALTFTFKSKSFCTSARLRSSAIHRWIVDVLLTGRYNCWFGSLYSKYHSKWQILVLKIIYTYIYIYIYMHIPDSICHFHPFSLYLSKLSQLFHTPSWGRSISSTRSLPPCCFCWRPVSAGFYVFSFV